MKKYYLLKRNHPGLFNEYCMDIISEEIRRKAHKNFRTDHTLILIEKTIVTDEIGTSEHYTNIWSMYESTGEDIQKQVKGRTMYDYTGIVCPLIHIKDDVMTWDQYCKRKDGDLVLKKLP